MNNSHASKDDGDFWTMLTMKDHPRNDDERRERELINVLWPRIKGDLELEHIVTSLVTHYNTIIFRLKFSLDGLSDKFDPDPKNPAS